MPDVTVTPQPWLWVPRTEPIRFIEIHATRGNAPPASQKGAALNWVQSPANTNRDANGNPLYQWGSSFSHVIGTDGSMGTVLDDNQMPTFSAGFGGPNSTWAIDEYAKSYELAQSQALEPFDDRTYRRLAKEVAIDIQQYGIPPVFVEVFDQSGPVPTGLVRHDKTQNGVILGKTDPGNQFDEFKFIALLVAEMMEDEMALVYTEKTVGGVKVKTHYVASGPWVKRISRGVAGAEKAYGEAVKVGQNFIDALWDRDDLKKMVEEVVDNTRLKSAP